MDARGRRDTIAVARKIDLHKQPAPIRYAIALAVVAIVVTAAWFVGDRKVPSWIEVDLVPALGWVYLGLLVIALASRLLRR